MQLTPRQQSVFHALEQAQAPLSAYMLLERIRKPGLNAPVQVYRTLEQLIEQGLVHRLESLNAYIACSCPDECSHGLTAFAICTQCGRIDTFIDRTVTQGLQHWAATHAFNLKRTAIEMRGQCATCAGLAQAATCHPQP